MRELGRIGRAFLGIGLLLTTFVAAPDNLLPTTTINAEESGPPARQVAFISGIERCTATFVGPDVLLTAAHCVGGKDGSATAVTVIPGRDGTSSPYGASVSRAAYIPPAWTNAPSPENDWALVLLANSAMGNLVGWQTIAFWGTYDPGPSVTIIGYPFEALERQTRYQGYIYSSQSGLLYTSIDGHAGVSGAAITTKRGIVGLVSHRRGPDVFPDWTSFGAVMDRAKMTEMTSACNRMGCALSYIFYENPYEKITQIPALPPPPQRYRTALPLFQR